MIRGRQPVATAVHHEIMMRVVFFPMRCSPKYHSLLQTVAEHADDCLSRRYGSTYRSNVSEYLHLHWCDITRHVGRKEQHVRGVYPVRAESVRRQRAAQEAARFVQELAGECA